jgi:hypothetical protein
MNLLRAGALVLLAACVSCGSEMVVSIRVSDAVSGNALPGSVIRSGRGKTLAVTGKSGECIIRPRTIGELRAHHDGYFEQALSVCPAGYCDGEVRVQFRLPPVSTTTGLMDLPGATFSLRKVTVASATYLDDDSSPPGSSMYKPSSGIVTGTVIDGQTGDWLAGVNIVLDSTQFGTTTDTRGVFRITGIPAGTYGLHLSYMGYEDAVIHFRADPRQPTVIKFRLQAVEVRWGGGAERE